MTDTPFPTCPVCGTKLVLSSGRYACCPANLEHTKLIRLTHSQRCVLNTPYAGEPEPFAAQRDPTPEEIAERAV